MDMSDGAKRMLARNKAVLMDAARRLPDIAKILVAFKRVSGSAGS